MNKFIVLSFSALVLVLQGCAAGPYKPIRYDTNQDLERMSNVVIMDKELDNQFGKKRVTILGEKSELTEDGRLKVFCEIRNMKKDLLRIQIQTVFKDEGGFSIDQDTPWELVLIPSFATQTYITTALNTKAKKYTIRIQKAK